jgi:hypothetical protein
VSQIHEFSTLRHCNKNLTSLYLIPTTSGRKIIIKQFGARGGCFQPNLIMAITNDILIELIKKTKQLEVLNVRTLNEGDEDDDEEGDESS